MPMKNNKRQTNKKERDSSGPSSGRAQGITRLATGSQLQFGFPNRVISKVRYVDTYAMVSTAGSIAKQVLFINSTFDPDNTGIGHQPLYRDTFASIYDQYAVISADVVITFVVLSTSPMLVGHVIDDDATTSTSVNTLCEQNNGQNALLPNTTGAPTTATFRYHWDCKKILSIDPFASETYKTAVGSNPTEVSALLLWAAPADLTSSTTTFAHIELEQTVLWTELNTQIGN